MSADIKKLKTRIRSVDSTMHITKAMELVASSKFRRAVAREAASRPYFCAMTEAVSHLSGCESVFATARPERKLCYLLIAGDRGLAGGYNQNLYKFLQNESAGKCFCTVPIGKRAVDFVTHRGYETIASIPEVEDATAAQTAEIGRLLAERFAAGEIDGIFVIYTKYVSVLTQLPAMQKLLPIEKEAEPKEDFLLFEPSCEAVLNAVVPEYLSGMIYSAICESFASELAARRTAMDAASQNAEEMIGKLTLRFNRARQGAITQEITEIIGGSVTE